MFPFINLSSSITLPYVFITVDKASFRFEHRKIISGLWIGQQALVSSKTTIYGSHALNSSKQNAYISDLYYINWNIVLTGNVLDMFMTILIAYRYQNYRAIQQCESNFPSSTILLRHDHCTKLPSLVAFLECVHCMISLVVAQRFQSSFLNKNAHLLPTNDSRLITSIYSTSPKPYQQQIKETFILMFYFIVTAFQHTPMNERNYKNAQYTKCTIMSGCHESHKATRLFHSLSCMGMMTLVRCLDT